MNDQIPFPMPEYIAAWKVYRTFSNEDTVTAVHLASKIRPLLQSDSKILDIGPGDGRVLLRLLLRLPAKPSKLTFIEPNKSFMKETQSSIGFHEFAGEIKGMEKPLSSVDQGSINEHDVIICSHAAYFLSDAEMDKLYFAVKCGATLLVVLDDEESIFSKLWAETAPDYLKNAKRHTRTIRNLVEEGFRVVPSKIQAQLADPLKLRPEMRDLILSMLCYSDIQSWEDEVSKWAVGMVRGDIAEGRLNCTSNCFVISHSG